MSSVIAQDSTGQRQGGVWRYLSASRLNLWLKCPLAFKLKYIDGHLPPVTPGLFLGKVVHSGLETHYRHRQLGMTLGVDQVVDSIKRMWPQQVEEEGIKFESTKVEDALQSQAVDLVTAYLQHVPVDEQVPMAVETSLEAPLVDPSTGEELGIPLVGVVDLVQRTDDGSAICDFKTAARSGTPVEISHEIQLSCYAYLFRQVTGESEQQLEIRSLIKTKAPKIEFHRFPARTETHFKRLFAVIRAYLDDLDSGRFVYRPGFGCSMCDFRDGPCRSWAG